MEEINIGLALAAGLLSFVSPCVLPLVPAYIGYMGGRATRNVALEKKKVGAGGAAQAMTARANMLLHGAAFVAGFTLVFVIIGLMTTAFVSILGGSVNVLTEIIGRVGGIIIITFGLHFMGALRWGFKWLKNHRGIVDNILWTIALGAVISLLIVWGFVEFIVALPLLAGLWLYIALSGGLTQPGEFWFGLISRFENAIYADTRPDLEPTGNDGLAGSFFMGVVFSAGWTPCIGPLLGTILTLAATTGDIGQAVPLLIAYSLGLGIPFMLTALLFEGAQSLLRRLQRHMHTIELLSGSLLVVIGVLVASGQLQSLSTTLSTEQADVSLRIEECGIGFIQREVAFNQIGSCLGGSLHLVALGQSAIGAFGEHDELEYVVNIEEPTFVEVELDRLRVFDLPDTDAEERIQLENPDEINVALDITVTLLDASGTPLATSDTLTFIEDDEYLALSATQLDAAGQYTVIITDNGTDEDFQVDFRLRIREASEAASSSAEVIELVTNEAAGSATSELASNLANQEASADAITIGLDVGNRAPDFSVTTIEGEEIALSDLRGQVVALNFWGTWCGPCRREMPEFQQAFEAYGDEGFTILGLAVRGDTRADVLQFRDEFGLTFPLAVDEGDRINDEYGITSQPSTLILDEDGVIMFKNFGLITESQLHEALATALQLEMES